MYKKIIILAGLIVILVLITFMFGYKSDFLATKKCGPQPRSIKLENRLNTDNWKTVDEGYGYKLKVPQDWGVSHIQNGLKNTYLDRQGSSITITEIDPISDSYPCGSTLKFGDRQYNVTYAFDTSSNPDESWLNLMDLIVSTTELSATESAELDPNVIYKIDGYYSTYDRLMYPLDYDPSRDSYPATTTCSAFTILDGDTKFISYYTKRMSRGNLLNTLNNEKNLVINIQLEEVGSPQKDLLLKSNIQNQVSLGIKIKPPLESDADYCESLISVISVQ